MRNVCIASVILALGAFCILPLKAHGQLSGNSGFDVEIDPIAYALNGFSVHAGYLTGLWRLDLGIFGLDFPEWMHSNEAFKSSFVGAGWKVDRFFQGKLNGFFAGVEGGVTRLDVTHESSDTERDRVEYSLGVRGGYRWNTGLGNLYVTPWLGLGFTLNGEDIMVNGDVYESSVFQPFPTVHIGWKF